MPLDAGSGGLRALVIDGDSAMRRALAVRLEELGCAVAQAASGTSAIEAARRERFELAICDLELAAGSGLDLLSDLLAEQPALSIVVITGAPALETAVEAVRRGARDYLSKPLTSAQLRALVADELERRAALSTDRFEELLECAVPPAIRELARRAASHDAPVLLRGEQGTWKGALARAIHERTPRRGGPFVEMSSRTGRPEELLGELLDRLSRATGGVHEAEGGTLFLDEVWELPAELQHGLLRLLQENEQASAARGAGVRIVASTSVDLGARLRGGLFHPDLLHRLAVLEIDLPPLRARPQDILPLARILAERFARQRGAAAPSFPLATRRLLVTWPWPGNVRELREVLERAISMEPGGVLGPEAFPEWMAPRGDDAPIAGASLTAEALEREHVTRVLAWATTVAEASQILGLDPSTLRRKLRSWELRAREASAPPPWSEGSSRRGAG